MHSLWCSCAAPRSGLWHWDVPRASKAGATRLWHLPGVECNQCLNKKLTLALINASSMEFPKLGRPASGFANCWTNMESSKPHAVLNHCKGDKWCRRGEWGRDPLIPISPHIKSKAENVGGSTASLPSVQRPTGFHHPIGITHELILCFFPFFIKVALKARDSRPKQFHEQ